MHNLLEQWRERGSLSKAGSRTKRADYDVETSEGTIPPRIYPWKRPLLLRFVRPQVNKILHVHHYCANCERTLYYVERMHIALAMGSLHRKFHSYICWANARNTMSRFRTHHDRRILLRRDTCARHYVMWIKTTLLTGRDINSNILKCEYCNRFLFLQYFTVNWRIHSFASRFN